MSTIKKFDEFVNEMLLKENKSSDNYGKTNIMSALIIEFVKKYYNTDYRKIAGQQYLNFIEKHPELWDFIDYLEDNEDNFTIGVYFYANVYDDGYVDYSVEDVDNNDYERCIKTIKSYTDKNMVNKMLSIIDDVINDKIDLGEVVEYANEHNDDWEEFRRSEYADARIEDYRLNKD